MLAWINGVTRRDEIINYCRRRSLEVQRKDFFLLILLMKIGTEY